MIHAVKQTTESSIIIHLLKLLKLLFYLDIMGDADFYKNALNN